MLDLMEVNTYKLMDCNVAHHTKEIVQYDSSSVNICFSTGNFRVNNRKYSFGNEEGAYDWVCSKVPDNGRIKKDCVPKVCQVNGFKETCMINVLLRERLLPGTNICF